MSKFDRSHFRYINEKQIPDDLICCICKEVFNDPIAHECGNMFCKSCWNKKTKPNCPLCNSVSPEHKVPLMVTNTINELLVECVKCNITMKHEKAKDHQMKRCPLKCKECKEICIGMTKLQEHNKDICVNRKVICGKVSSEKNYKWENHITITTNNLKCEWKGYPRDLSLHRCAATFRDKAIVDSMNSIMAGHHLNPIDKSMIGQLGWVRATWISFVSYSEDNNDGDVTLSYINPFTKEKMIETLNYNNNRIGRYCDHDDRINWGTKFRCHAIQCFEPSNSKRKIYDSDDEWNLEEEKRQKIGKNKTPIY